MNYNWVDGFSIMVQSVKDEVIISANREGLISLAIVLQKIADELTQGTHVHLDQYNSLEDNSLDLIIEKI